jgi:hypothetical protein
MLASIGHRSGRVCSKKQRDGSWALSAGRRGRGRHGGVLARVRRRDGCVVRRLGAGTLTDLAQSLETRAHSLPAIPGKEYVPSFCIACSPSVDPTRPCLAVGSRDYSLTA